jgi:hypothetical protein
MATTCPHCGAPIPSAAAAGTAQAAGPTADKRELRVASDGSGDVTSLQEGVKRIPEGGIIRVAAGGIYNETLTLTRTVTIMGEAGGTPPLLQSVGQRLLTVEGATVMLRGLTLHCINPKSGSPEDNAGAWCKSGHLSAENCKLVCDQGTSLLVNGQGNAQLTKCQVEGSQLWVEGAASVQFKECELTAPHCLILKSAGRVTINGGTCNGGVIVNGTCHFKTENTTWNCGRDEGISVSEQARGEIESCQIGGSVRCSDTAKVELSNSRVQVPAAERYGMALSLTGEGQTRVVNCEILGNQASTGVWGKESHNVRIERSRITGHADAVQISDQVQATVENCDLRGNARTFDAERSCRLRQSGNRQ